MFEQKINEFFDKNDFDNDLKMYLSKKLNNHVNTCVDYIKYANNINNVYDINISLFDDFFDDDMLLNDDCICVIKIDYYYLTKNNEIKTRHELYYVDCDYEIFNYKLSCEFIFNMIFKNNC